MPNSLLEAMACKNLVLASDAGGIPEVLTHGENGVILSKNHLNHLGAAIQETLELPLAERNKMQNAARQSIEEHFTAAHEERALETTIRSISQN
jgi:glycosyltransferase involved in cell wall biosynthesis